MNPKEKVYNFISEQLTSGRLQRSDRLTEQYLADHLGISRTPIREALLQLAADDILEREPRKGFKLKRYSEQDVEELYELIGILDGRVAQLALPLLTGEDFANMNFFIDSMYSAIDLELYTKYNELQEQFHDVYIKKCKNSLLKNELYNKKKIFIGKSYCRVDKDIIKDLLCTTNEEHETILALFKDQKDFEVRHFLETIHWNKKNARYDIW